MLKNMLALIALPIAIAACGPRHPEVAMPIGHPANPASAKGQALAAPAALRSEIVSVSPRVPSGESGLNPLQRNKSPNAHGGHGG
jgi:hypothetical protein